ncbi:MAG TPA: hypothetical protein GXX17_03000 [Clostridiales bacterium]|nr:hypothetical protein [Clostridiales bacterium]
MKIMYKAFAFLLVIRLSLFCSVSVDTITAQAAANSITYQYYSDQNGNAGGKITILSDTMNGEVKLYWGRGGRKLDNYSELATATLEAGRPTTIEIQKFTAIPEGALQLIAYSNGKPVHSLVYQIPAYKLPNFGAKRYSFGAVSDIHLNTRPESFSKALNFLKDYGCAFVCVAGDITHNGDIAELDSYKTIVSPYSSTMPVYAIAGNHDAQGGIDENLWEMYTGHGLCYAFDYCEDRFVFISTSKWDFQSPSSEILTKEQLDWLEKELEANKGKRVYLFQHVFLNNTCGNIYYPDGNGVYELWFTEGTADEKRFRNLMSKYRNLIWFSGHSHWKFYLQYLNRDINIYGGDGKYCTMVHIPSITYPRDYIDGRLT